MFNFIEKFILKRLAKKIVNKLPKLKEKGVDLICCGLKMKID
jgi:hypothetical protein